MIITDERIKEIAKKHCGWKVIKLEHIHSAIKEAVEEDRRSIADAIEECLEPVITGLQEELRWGV